jgi:hypothetical protein
MCLSNLGMVLSHEAACLSDADAYARPMLE